MATMEINHDLDGESMHVGTVVILSVASVLSTVAVSMRCYARSRLLHSFGLDDAVMAMAQVLTIASAVIIGLESHWGLGRHTWMVSAENVAHWLKAFYASIIVYNVAVCLTKISILLQYRRIFSSHGMRRVTTVGLVIIGCWTVTLVILLSFPCRPIAKVWEPTLDGYCVNFPLLWYSMSSMNLISDFAILIMPLPVLRSLQLPSRQKTLLIAVFCLGVFPCGVSVYRIRTLQQAVETTDPMWDGTGAATWSFLELTSGVITACLPTLRPIFVAILPRWFGSGSSSRSRGTSALAMGSRTVGGRPGDGSHKKSGNNTYMSQGGGAHSADRIVPSSYMKDSDSTDGLHVARTSTSGGEEDVEFGPMESTAPRTGAAYSVSVVAGWDATGDSHRGAAGGPEKGAIKTTTVVSQHVSIDGGRASRGNKRGSVKSAR